MQAGGKSIVRSVSVPLARHVGGYGIGAAEKAHGLIGEVGSNVEQHASVGWVFLPCAGPWDGTPAVEGRFEMHDPAHRIFAYEFIECLKVTVPASVVKRNQVRAFFRGQPHELGDL